MAGYISAKMQVHSRQPRFPIGAYFQNTQHMISRLCLDLEQDLAQGFRVIPGARCRSTAFQDNSWSSCLHAPVKTL